MWRWLGELGRELLLQQASGGGGNMDMESLRLEETSKVIDSN